MNINWRSPMLVIASGCLVAMLGFGTRSMFGFFMEPMTGATGWSRGTFSLAMAIQNLLWGLAVPIAGAIADKYGPMCGCLCWDRYSMRWELLEWLVHKVFSAYICSTDY